MQKKEMSRTYNLKTIRKTDFLIFFALSCLSQKESEIVNTFFDTKSCSAKMSQKYHAKLQEDNSYSAAMETVKSTRGSQSSLWEGNTNSLDISEEREKKLKCVLF